MRPPRHLLRFLLSALIGGTLAAPRTAVAQGGSRSRTVIGRVVDKVTGLALPYSAVSLTTLDREVLTDDRGIFRIGDLPQAATHLRVRHVGYTPIEREVTGATDATDTLRIELEHIAVHLTPMLVTAEVICDAPGAPAQSDSIVLVVFNQLKQNAEQFQLIARRYPFVSIVERTRFSLFAPEMRSDEVDTLYLESKAEWHYEPGAILRQLPRSRGGGVTMNIPTLANFADKAFISNHCFRGGGLVTIDNVDLVQIDFYSAMNIRDADVEGSIYLDPKSFQIRRSVLRLNKFARVVPEMIGNETTTIFGEIYPSVPVMTDVLSVMALKPDLKQATPLTGRREDHRLLSIGFRGKKPGDDAKPPR